MAKVSLTTGNGKKKAENDAIKEAYKTVFNDLAKNCPLVSRTNFDPDYNINMGCIVGVNSLMQYIAINAEEVFESPAVLNWANNQK